MTKENELSPFEYMYQDSHLSGSEIENALCEFEMAMLHLSEAFRRWSTNLNALICNESLPVQDVNVLQVLRMRDRPKSVLEIAHALNREDSPNIAYSLRKLEKLGLAERPKDSRQNQTVYQVTDLGREATEQYAILRKDILVPMVSVQKELVKELEDSTSTIASMVGLYDRAGRRVGMLRTNDAPLSSKKKSTRRKSKKKPPSKS